MNIDTHINLYGVLICLYGETWLHLECIAGKVVFPKNRTEIFDEKAADGVSDFDVRILEPAAFY